MTLAKRIRQAWARAVAGWGRTEDELRMRARLCEEGVLPKDEDLPFLLREQAD